MAHPVGFARHQTRPMGRITRVEPRTWGEFWRLVRADPVRRRNLRLLAASALILLVPLLVAAAGVIWLFTG